MSAIDPDKGGGKITVEESDSPRAAVITLSGHFMLIESKALTEAIEALVLKGVKNIIFDLTNTSYMNSTAIGALANCAASTKGFGGDTVLFPTGATVMNVLDMLGLVGLFSTASSREEAIEKLA